MKKINLSLLATSLVISALVADESSVELEKISVVTKTQKSIDGVAASIEVITQQDIEKMGASSLRDIIQRAEGLNVMFGTFPSASSKSKSSITIRGMSPNGTLILLDGRRLAGEVQNPYDLDRIPASVVERVEIVKGPMSSLYGADAVGGVINIITKQPCTKLKIDAGARYGANKDGDGDEANFYLSLQDKIDRFAYSAYATYTTTKPYTKKESENVWAKAGATNVKPSLHGNPGISGNVKDTYETDVTYREDSDVYTFGTHLEYDFSDKFSMGFDVNYFDESRKGSYIGYFHPSNYVAGGNKIPLFNVPVDSQDDNKRLDLSIDATLKASDNLELKARVYRSDYEKRNKTTAQKWQDMGYASKNDSAQNGLNADVELMVAELGATYLANNEHLLSIGGEYKEEKRDSSVFTQSNEMTRKKVDYKSVYLQDEYQITQKLSAIFGARYDAISTADNKATFRVGGVYEFDKMAKVRANFAQGYRAADLRELYIFKQTPTGLQVGSEAMGYNLKPESTNAYEIGVAGNSANFSYDLALFYNDIKDMIAQSIDTYNGTKAYTFKNVADAKTSGIELSLGYDISEDLKAKAFWSELYTKDKKLNQALSFQPSRVISLGLDYDFTQAFSGGVFAKYIGKQHYDEILNRGAPNETIIESKTADFTLVDLRADYKLSKIFTLYGGIDNIADKKVDNILGSNVGRYFFLGARASF